MYAFVRNESHGVNVYIIIISIMIRLKYHISFNLVDLVLVSGLTLTYLLTRVVHVLLKLGLCVSCSVVCVFIIQCIVYHSIC